MFHRDELSFAFWLLCLHTFYDLSILDEPQWPGCMEERSGRYQPLPHALEQEGTHAVPHGVECSAIQLYNES